MNSVFVKPGQGGWGKGLLLVPNEKRKVVASITGGGVHPTAQRIAELSGCEAVDAFNNKVEFDDMLCAVINCGGTARIGVYPTKGVPTVDVLPSSPSGPLADNISADIFVSGVTPDDVSLADGTEGVAAATAAPAAEKAEAAPAPQPAAEQTSAAPGGFLTKLGTGIGKVMAVFYQAGRDSVNMIIRNVLPFMAFIAMLSGIISYTGLGNAIASVLTPLAGTLPGLCVIVLICTIPIVSPILGPGAVIAQVIGVLVGEQIGLGNIAVQFALPALFAIDGQVGCDFIPVGLSLGEAEPETVSAGVTAVMYERFITGILSVLIAFVFSFLVVY
ncbi:MAG: PTS glucitol/sorbitol transporter subunit IIB [Atopobiaceae bacterium]|jgi:PTS system glucitol/sorbitol-specific IIC component|nr:PTS glucitol/sorbitol transporter subunit IIB [Atopobiaceae bacterium]MCH4119452.1 PTS glucitol/sorbitol transporter subunit IIB [Atopobiaceae bacterium]MCI1318986.1 PTS glucitol/sorbitol transporter subunit IIB [Atopobiaceae bacterium]MCI1389039.1 PTS glucitol/sorbitol transporter subunit IIB [Atopobiaceae bacterium]MCI1431727.1 PTS glucitol/sorbitol transporter subunit IIB [Atopobiaceae bacterium]